MKKQELIGRKLFEFEMNEKTGEVLLERYIPDDEEYKVIEIPDFVTGFKVRHNNCGNIKSSVFTDVSQSLKVISKNKNIKSMAYLFYSYRGNELDLSEFDTSEVTNMSCMFLYANNLTEVDMSNFDTSKVETMRGMFSECNIEKIDFDLDTSNVKNMGFMFNGCSNLKELNLNKMDTSNVRNMSYMFCMCKRLEKIDVRGFDTSRVNTMQNMFMCCTHLKKLDISNFDMRNVESVNQFVESCVAVSELNLGKFELGETIGFKDMFMGCTKKMVIKTSNKRLIDYIKCIGMNCEDWRG